MYYRACWGNFARYASNEAMLNMPVAGKLSPIQRAGGTATDLEEVGHVPGAKCTYWLPQERRSDRDDVPGRIGMWAHWPMGLLDHGPVGSWGQTQIL